MRPEPREPAAPRVSDRDGGQLAAFASVATLFFAWGFITVTVDPLIAAAEGDLQPVLRGVMLTQFAFFMAYGVVSLPAAALIRRVGYTNAIVVALAVMIAGCLIVPLATHFETFAIVLVALFVIAAGITILQVAANPLAAALGPPQRSHFRLTLVQAFNSLGTAIAPYLASSLLLAGGIFAVTGSGRHGATARRVARPHRSRLLHHRGTHCAAGSLHLVGARAPAGGSAAAVTPPRTLHQGGPAVTLGAARRGRNLPVRGRGSLDRQPDDELPAPGGRLCGLVRTGGQAREPLLAGRDGGALRGRARCSRACAQGTCWGLPPRSPPCCA